MSVLKLSPKNIRSEERTGIIGYLLAIIAGNLSYYVAKMSISGDYVSRFDIASLLAYLFIPIFVLCLVIAVPFGIVRYLADAKCFAVLPISMGLGSGLGLLAIPIVVELSRLVKFNLQGAFQIDLTSTTKKYWCFYLVAGAVAGLTYWTVEFSLAPSAILHLATDIRPVRWTRGRLSRRLATALTLTAAVGVATPVARWWFRPHVTQAMSGPVASFIREWPMRGWVSFLSWASDQSSLISFAESVVTIQTPTGHMLWEKRFSDVRSWGAVANDRVLIVPGYMNSHTAFTAIDLQTHEITHEQPDPVPDARGVPGAGVNLAMSSDGALLAVSYGAPREGQPVSVYDTQSWKLLSKIDLPPSTHQFSKALGFSADIRYVAFAAGKSIVIADVSAGTVINTLGIKALEISFSPKGDLVAVVTPDSGGTFHRKLEIYDLSKGAMLASHAMTASLIGPSVSWDPKGRFIVFADDHDKVLTCPPRSEPPVM